MSESRPAPNGLPSAHRTATTDANATERADTIWQLRLQGLSLRAIGKRVGMSHQGVKDILDKTRAELIYPKIEEARELELDRLDELTRIVSEILHRDHALVSHGRLILDPATGEPLPDDDPRMKAVDRLLRISERRAKLLGLDAATKVEAQVFAPETNEVRALAEEAARRLAGADKEDTP